MRMEQDQDGGMEWEDADSGMRREQDNSMHSEKDREDIITSINLMLNWNG